MDYYQKYLKYKGKYISLKNQLTGGAIGCCACDKSGHGAGGTKCNGQFRMNNQVSNSLDPMNICIYCKHPQYTHYDSEYPKAMIYDKDPLTSYITESCVLPGFTNADEQLKARRCSFNPEKCTK